MAQTNIDLSGLFYSADVTKLWCREFEHDYRTWAGDWETFQTVFLEKSILAQKKHKCYVSDENSVRILEQIYIYANWLRYKKVYDFHPTFVKYLAETDSGNISKELLKRLPYKTFYMAVGHYPMPNTFLRDYKAEEIRGLMVDWQLEGDKIELGINLEYTNTKGEIKSGADWLVLQTRIKLRDGESFKSIFGEDLELNEEWYAKHGIIKSELEEAIEFWSPIFKIVINGSQYLCASNAEIKDVHISKKDRNKAKHPLAKRAMAVDSSKVGYHLGIQFEKMYFETESSQSSSGGGRVGIKKRPHVRRAHWHHYWTGPGRTVLEVKWLEPVFVVGSEKELETVVHPVKGA